MKALSKNDNCFLLFTINICMSVRLELYLAAADEEWLLRMI